MPLPWPSRQFVKLLPIAFVPSGHFIHAVPLLTKVYAFVASLDAASHSKVASSYLRPSGEILYSDANSHRAC
jgi:hypothetical protein